MDRYIDVPEYTVLGDGDLGVQVMAIFRAFPWRLDAALVRERWGPPGWHNDRASQLWDDTDNLVGLWDYLLDRGGNGITWDLDAWTVRTTDAVPPAHRPNGRDRRRNTRSPRRSHPHPPFRR